MAFALGAFTSGLFEGAKTAAELERLRLDIEDRYAKIDAAKAAQNELDKGSRTAVDPVTMTMDSPYGDTPPATSGTSQPAPQPEETKPPEYQPKGKVAGVEELWPQAKKIIGQYESNNNYSVGYGVGDTSHYPDMKGFYGFPDRPSVDNSRATGFYQMQPDTWQRYARQYEEETGKTPNFRNPADQDEVAKRLYLAEGWGPWAPYNTKLRVAAAQAGLLGGAVSPAALKLKGATALPGPTGPESPPYTGYNPPEPAPAPSAEERQRTAELAAAARFTSPRSPDTPGIAPSASALGGTQPFTPPVPPETQAPRPNMIPGGGSGSSYDPAAAAFANAALGGSGITTAQQAQAQALSPSSPVVAPAPTAPVAVPRSALLGQLRQGNVDMTNRPEVFVPERGAPGTVYSMGVRTPQGVVLIPRIADLKLMSPDEAIARYRRTGEHLGIYSDEESADAAGRAISRQEADRLRGGRSY